MRDRLSEIIQSAVGGCAKYWADVIADKLIAEGVIVTPCVAMVEQFIKDGKFDTKHTAHNGRVAVVYVDKSKWGSPLIDITEQFYDNGKALERIQELSERRKYGKGT